MRPALLLGALALGLSACTVSVRSNLGLVGSSSNLIADVRPDRGAGATYYIGEPVRISVTTRAPGYVTLVALQPNGYASTLIRNAYVPAGTTVFPRAQDAVTYNVAPPTGLQRVRAIFTRVRPTTDLVLSGVYDVNGWNTVTTQYVQPYAQADRDVQETYFYIR
ncbi:DUF4384 domain-containing protein [Deinococcus metallilatus]|uniref:DUF4384 domain-containing protein n=1 Tax=Deinococcus metallilatus TaxID=1211322 RepID=A0AAJ5F291_9DEIO|nr:DUF4384 domain-containing protein [Deinococcus metallilatus]MBB5296868.1 hypothetical protein [Deinococcus metallilatus]QBY09601.1 DUF4384 domain-containing protein [Deinococcus metallilatus]RXJ09205.1 DUF4384 domain-containing protein [Deinococcus metallilatus]TLK22751.1 DUF4384 domain-containing protein [Deinococcus metallilatus]GMA13902.1 hypothetical protein GCM10025871_02330 [Deinococcus metallilatus]